MSGSGTGPDEHLEDLASAFCQMADNKIIILATVGTRDRRISLID